MKHLLVTATALGLAFGGSALAQSTTTQVTSDMWSMDLACSDFVAASEADQRQIIASYESHRQGMGGTDSDSGSDATGSAAEVESNMAINSGADVSSGTRGTTQSGTAALTAEGAEGDPAGTVYQEVELSDVVEACESSPDRRVSEVVDREQTQ